MGADSTPSSKGVADMEMQFQNNKDDTSVRNLIDLNAALPFMDDTEMDAYQSEGDTVPQEPDGPSNEALAITAAAENLMVMHTSEFLAGSPQGNILHWFAGLATSGESTVVYSSNMDNVDTTLKL